MRTSPIDLHFHEIAPVQEGVQTQVRRVVSPTTCEVLGYRVTAKSPAWTGMKLDRAVAREKCPLTGVARPHLGVPWVHPEDEARGMEADAIYRVDPIWEVDDRLWVREAVGRRAASFFGIEAKNGVESAYYLADGEDVVEAKGFNLCPWWRGKTCPPARMPRWASRTTLIVKAVRVERLQDISEADAAASGVEDRGPGIGCRVRLPNGGRVHSGSAKQCFASAWVDLHGEDSWIANPWVVVLTVAPVPAEDAVGRDALSTEDADHGR